TVVILDSYYFFFQAEDGIRDATVTGVQTCALPICHCSPDALPGMGDEERLREDPGSASGEQWRQVGGDGGRIRRRSWRAVCRLAVGRGDRPWDRSLLVGRRRPR